MERSSFSYLKQFLDAVDIEDLTYEERCRATYALCYYAIKGVFPPEATGHEKMHVKDNLKMLEGQDNFKGIKSEEGKIGGTVSPSGLTDEQIREAYAALYFEKGGKYPTEQEVIAKTGANVQSIRSRKVWKNENQRDWIEMYRSVYDIQQNVDDIHKSTVDIHTYTAEDF